MAGSAHAARPANWTPFAPHGWLSVGRAASTLMLSFVGWEAVAPLTGRLRAGQLSRVIGIAFTVTAVLYLGLAVATISCLGRGANLAVPLADLLQLAIGPAGRAVAAVAALVLTAARSTPTCRGRPRCCASSPPYAVRRVRTSRVAAPALRQGAFLGFIALAGLVLIAMSALRAGRHRGPGKRADHDVPVRLPQLHRIRGAHPDREARAAAAVAVLAVLTILAFCGWALLAAAVVAVVAALAGAKQCGISRSRRRMAGCCRRPRRLRSVVPVAIRLSREDVPMIEARGLVTSSGGRSQPRCRAAARRAPSRGRPGSPVARPGRYGGPPASYRHTRMPTL